MPADTHLPGSVEVPLAAAALRLGTSQEALRKRLRRGALQGTKRGAQWFVLLPAGPPAEGQGGTDAGHGGTEAGQQAILELLQRENDTLRAALERSQAGEAELRRLLQQALPARLTAPVDATAAPADSPDFARSAESDGVAPAGSVELPRRRWWRFWQGRA